MSEDMPSAPMSGIVIPAVGDVVGADDGAGVGKSVGNADVGTAVGSEGEHSGVLYRKNRTQVALPT